VHAVIPRELDDALRDAGVTTWRIWRDGQDLFHVVECEDYRAMRAHLREHPANVPWQARMDELLDVADDYGGTDRGLGLVWELP
jgi:L-rhamnose mutarotase